MNKLKITLITVIAILFVAICGIIGFYIVDNHNQVLSWLKNEKAEAKPSVDNPGTPLPQEKLNELEQLCKETDCMIIVKVHKRDVGFDSIIENVPSANPEMLDFIIHSEWGFEGYEFKGYSLTEDGEPIDSLEFEPKVVVLYGLFEKLPTVNISLHLGNTVLTKDVYKDYDYTDNWFSMFDGIMAQDNLGFAGFATTPDETENVSKTISAPGDYYLVLVNFNEGVTRVNSSNALYVEQYDYNNFLMSRYLFLKGSNAQLLEKFNMVANYLENVKGWSTSFGSTDTVNIDEDVFNTYSKFYAVFNNEPVNNEVKICFTKANHVQTLDNYADLISIEMDNEGLKFNCASGSYTYPFLSDSGYSYVGLSRSPEDTSNLITNLEEGGFYYVVYRDSRGELVTCDKVLQINWRLEKIDGIDGFNGSWFCYFESDISKAVEFFNNFEVSRYGEHNEYFEYELSGFSLDENGDDEFVSQMTSEYLTEHNADKIYIRVQKKV